MLLSPCCLSAFLALGAADVQTDPRLRGYVAPDGVKVEIVAEAPADFNPVGMAFADDGTPFVLERRRGKDAVRSLVPGKGGTFEAGKVVLEDERVAAMLAYDGWLYVGGGSTVRRYRPGKEGGAHDVKEVVARGFREVVGLAIGHGSLYVSASGGDHVVEGSDGSRAALPGTGAVFRCRPDGSQVEVFARGLRGARGEIAIDAVGQMFLVDDREDGGRLLHLTEGSDFGSRSPAARCCVPDDVRKAVLGEPPGTLPVLLQTGRGTATGLVCYNDAFLPESYRGLLYHPNPARRRVVAYRVKPNGTTFKVVEQIEFLKSDDPHFRPVQVAVGPDGALYVVDRRADPADGKSGRLYRLTWAGTKDQPALAPRPSDSWAKLSRLTDGDLVKALAGENQSDRDRARAELVRRGGKNRDALLAVLGDVEQPPRARVTALLAVEPFWSKEVAEAFTTLLMEQEDDLRRLAVEALGRRGEARGAAVLAVLDDGHPGVRRATALALARSGFEGSADILVNTLAEEQRDAVLHDGLVRAIERTGKVGVERLIALAESGDPKKFDRAIEAFSTLWSRPACDALPALLKNPHLSLRQRTELVRSPGRYPLDPPAPAGPLLDYLLANADEAVVVKLAGLEALSLAGGLKGERAQNWLLALLEDPEPGLRLSVIRAVEDTRLKKAAPALEKIADDVRRPQKERAAAQQALRALGDR